MTAREKDEEAERLSALASEMSARGMYQSGTTVRRQAEIRREAIARRRRYRLLIVVLVVIAVSALADPFTTNRIVTAIKGAALALTAPLALYFAVRTDQSVR